MKKKVAYAKVFRFLLLGAVILGVGKISYDGFQTLRHRQYYENLARMQEIQESGQEETESLTETDSMTEPVPGSENFISHNAEGYGSEGTAGAGSAERSGNTNQSVILKRFVRLYEQNQDLVGWLKIEDTHINYPVLQCTQDYYLTHNFDREEDKYGCLFVRENADVFTPGTNFIIYGHNMRDGSMFGDLDEYKSEEFYRAHNLIHFDTLYEERTYEIIAVFYSQVYRENEDVFKYYQFYQADTQEEFDDFYENIKALSLYDTGVTAEYGDTFLTLSTCAYHVENGRFVIVAVKRDEGSERQALTE